jgi:branched-subunit amino acid aminotransferase/4-amino-4-deoxychorismate lyase
MITIGTKVKVLKGCKSFDIPKGVSVQVIDIKELGKEFNYNVSVTFKFLNGFRSGNTCTLQARHPNRLQDSCVRLSCANPLKFIEVG